MEEVDIMGVKMAKQEEPSQDKEKGDSSKKPTKTQHKIGTFDFSMGESSKPYDLVHDVCEQGPKINLP